MYAAHRLGLFTGPSHEHHRGLACKAPWRCRDSSAKARQGGEAAASCACVHRPWGGDSRHRRVTRESRAWPSSSARKEGGKRGRGMLFLLAFII